MNGSKGGNDVLIFDARPQATCPAHGAPAPGRLQARADATDAVVLLTAADLGNRRAAPAARVIWPSRPVAGPGVGHRRIDRDLAGVGAEVQRRLVTFSVVQGEVRDGAIGGQVVAVAGMPVAIREREVGTCDLDADPVASREVVRGGDANDLDPVDLA